MKLKGLKLRNFRGYKNETHITFEDLTTFVGKNDAGKSTVLEALEIFFNNKVVVCERDDLSVNHDEGDLNIEITCIFSSSKESILLDSTSTTKLEDEYLLNDEGLLEIKKVFKATAVKPKPTTFIVCEHPLGDQYGDLLTLKITQLKTRAQDLDIPNKSYDARSSVSLRQAIWAGCSDLELATKDIPVDKEDTKKIYSQLEKFLPLYALFQSDRSSSDSDKEIVDPMKVAVQKALQELEPQIETIKNEVRARAIDTANKTLEKLMEMNNELANTLSPEFRTEPNFDSLFKLTINSDDNIPMNKRGSGIRRLVLLNFFRAEAERKLSENETNSSVIYAFEEPETSQHPLHQKMLVEAFLEISMKPNAQVIMTTHTPAICGLLPLESLRLVDNEGGKQTVNSNSDDVYKDIAEMLGVIPEPFSNNARALLLVEGKADVTFMRHTTKLLKNGDYISHTFDEKNIAIIPIGGCGNLKGWITQNIADQFALPWAILLDSDKGTNGEKTNKERILNLRDNGIKAYITKKRELENYIDVDCIENGDFFEPFSDTDDVKQMVNEAINIPKKEVLERLWPKMSVEQIRNAERYIDEEGNERFEFTEMIKDFLTMA